MTAMPSETIGLGDCAADHSEWRLSAVLNGAPIVRKPIAKRKIALSLVPERHRAHHASGGGSLRALDELRVL